jgi:hypothetical protein
LQFKPNLLLLLLQACQLLTEMAALSAPGSRLLITCADKTLYEAGQGLQGRYAYFANMWHFCMDDLLGESSAIADNSTCILQGRGEKQLQQREKEHAERDEVPLSPLAAAGWELCCMPETTAVIALKKYQMETYVAEYGGAECYFSAKVGSRS